MKEAYLHIIRKDIYEGGDIIKADTLDNLLEQAGDTARRIIAELCEGCTVIVLSDWDRAKIEQVGNDTIYGFAVTKPIAANAKQFRIKLFNESTSLSEILKD